MTDAAFRPAAGPSPAVEAAAAGPGPQRAPVGTDAAGRPWPPFAHASEAEMARILDFYGVQWAYEPRTFPILWSLDGEVVESFSPDFYLPELDLFLELTTLKQRLVRKKNRKLRRLRELYPDVRIKLFYARDFRAMMLKYGRLALVESLSGTLGQVMPERTDAEPIVAPSEPQPVAGPTAAPDDDLVPTADLAPDGGHVAGAPPRARRHLTVEPTPEAVPPPVAVEAADTGRPRNASRSRRRRAAAAARRAATLAAEAPDTAVAGRRADERAAE